MSESLTDSGGIFYLRLPALCQTASSSRPYQALKRGNAGRPQMPDSGALVAAMRWRIH